MNVCTKYSHMMIWQLNIKGICDKRNEILPHEKSYETAILNFWNRKKHIQILVFTALTEVSYIIDSIPSTINYYTHSKQLIWRYYRELARYQWNCFPRLFRINTYVVCDLNLVHNPSSCTHKNCRTSASLYTLTELSDQIGLLAIVWLMGWPADN